MVERVPGKARFIVSDTTETINNIICTGGIWIASYTMRAKNIIGLKSKWENAANMMSALICFL